MALGWIKEGLKERCITRDLKQGIKVPLKDFEDKVFYVWFDAPIGYVSSTKEIAPKNWEKFWKEKNARVYNFLGKDNIPFHTIFWPAMIMANGELNLPYCVEGLQYLNYEGKKFSKSKKIGVFCENLPKTGINPDIIRAYLTFILPETGDSEFKWKDFRNRINSDLIGNYGNFFNRTLSFIHNNLENNIKKPTESELTEIDRNLIDTTKRKVKNIEQYLENVQLKNAFTEILSLSTEGNKYLNLNTPWKSINENPQRTRHVLYLCADLCKTLAVISAPYLPNTSYKIWEQLNLEGKVDEPGIWNFVKDIIIPKNHKINKPKILFSRIEEEDIEKLKKETSNTKNVKELFR